MNLPDLREPAVLIAEDDNDDRLLLEMAFSQLEATYQLSFVADGEELLDYLHHRGKYARSKPPWPSLVLLDLNMPKKDGREVLLEMKSDCHLRTIPVIVWTTSSLEEDMRLCKEAGAEDYVTKPANLADLNASIAEIVKAWLEPPATRGAGQSKRKWAGLVLSGARFEQRRDL